MNFPVFSRDKCETKYCCIFDCINKIQININETEAH